MILDMAKVCFSTWKFSTFYEGEHPVDLRFCKVGLGIITCMYKMIIMFSMIAYS